MPHNPAPAFKCSSGPRTATIAIVGEAWGKDEDLVGLPFIGQSGQELTRMLSEAEIVRRECFLTNVFNFRPVNNDLTTICGSKKDVGEKYPFASISQGKYIMPEYLGELARLREELREVQPNVVIAMGNTAVWALMGTAKIGSVRGVAAPCTCVPGLKVLPTYHPAAVLRNWSYRPIVLADLMKAKRESTSKTIVRPQRFVLIDPTLSEISEWIEKWARNAYALSVDIETKGGQISCIGFGASRSQALVIPFIDKRKPNWCYWEREEEVAAWKLVRELLELPAPKIFQNGLFDLQYIYRMGFRPKNCAEDTMLLHHALYPELQKGLGFLGSIYTNEASWKLMRHRQEELKRDE